jgi:hypothetical protein
MRLRTLSDYDGDGFEQTYRYLGNEIGGKWAQMSRRMIDFIAYLEENIEHADIWAFISLSTLVLAGKDDYMSDLVHISADADAYYIEYPLQYDRPPFSGETVVQAFSDVESAAIMAMKVFDELQLLYTHETE